MSCVPAICALSPVAMILSAVLSWRSRWPISYRLIKSTSLTDKSMIWRPRVCSRRLPNFWLKLIVGCQFGAAVNDREWASILHFYTQGSSYSP